MNPENELKKLWQKGFFHLIVSNYSVQLIVFAAHLLIAKIMSPYYVGVIKTIETYVNIGIVLGSGGMIFAILKIVPDERYATHRQNVFYYALRYITIFSLFVFVISEILAFAGLISVDKYLNYWFRWYAAIIVPSVILQFFIRYYQALHQFKRISMLVFYTKLISIAVILSMTWLFYLKGYIFSSIITTTLIVLFLAYDLKLKPGDWLHSALPQSLKIQLKRLSRQAFTAQIVDQAKLQGSYLMTNYLITDRIMFGQYSFALVIVQGLNIFTSSVQQFIIPKLASRVSEPVTYGKTLRKFETWFAVIAGAAALLLAFALPLIIQAVFGHKYDEALPLLRWLLLGWFINALAALKGAVFLTLGQMKYIAIISGLIMLVVFPAAYYLISQYGVKGTAWTFVLQALVSTVLLFIFTRYILKRYARS